MRSSLISERDSWPRVAETNTNPVAALVELGIERREARWLVDEFLPGGDVSEMANVMAAAHRRLRGEPLQYILGHWPFRGLDVEVDPRVLIPRPETEELVDVALAELDRDVVAPLIVDLGCGSGVIGFSLVTELRERGVIATLVSVDESMDALAVAKRNALKHRLLTVSFVHSSWFDNVDRSLAGRIDIIVTNPPYVGHDEFAHGDPVLRYEPRGALVADDVLGQPGMSDIVDILTTGLTWLRPGGTLVLEHGADQRDAVVTAALTAGWCDVRDVPDLSHRPRILIARRPR